MSVELPVPDEPAHLAETVAANVADSRGDFDPDVDRRLPVTDDSPGRVILGNEITAYLWRAWEDALRDLGFTFLTFRNLLTGAAAAVARWATGDGDWPAVVEAVEATIDDADGVLRDALAK